MNVADRGDVKNPCPFGSRFGHNNRNEEMVKLLVKTLDVPIISLRCTYLPTATPMAGTDGV